MFRPSARSLRRAALLCALPAVLALSLAAPASASGGGGGGGGGGGSVLPALRSLTFAPAVVVGGGGDTATLTLASAASQGLGVDLSSDNPAVVSFAFDNSQNEAIAKPGTSSTQFAITTSAVTQATAVTITATVFGGGASISATLTVQPGTPPAPDTVRITQAQWKKGIQTISATSSSPNAYLVVFYSDGTYDLTLTNQGGGRFTDQRNELLSPIQITVRSDLGGSATANVTS
jgi:hypothetical protein